MTNKIERRSRIAAQIANYGIHLGLQRCQIDEATLIGTCLLDEGKSGATAYEAGRKEVDKYVYYSSSIADPLVA